jgi:hypothetical protein
MPSVTCPRCHTRQSIEPDVEGYTCQRCGTAWAFATCENCGTRFHMPPGTTEWTCPNCGYEHAPPEPERPHPAHAAPEAPVAAPNPLTARRLRLGSIAVVGIAAVLIGAFALTRGDGEPAPSPTPTSDAVQALCLHMRDLQTARVDALARVAASIAVDADAIEASGNPTLAANVRKLREAILAYRAALASQSGDSDEAAALANAISNLGVSC